MAFLESYLQKRIARFLIMFFAALLAGGLFAPAHAQDEDTDDDQWTGFIFDTSSDSWREAGEKGFDLRSGEYATLNDIGAESGDFVKISGFSPYWITLQISGKNVLFSTDEDNNDKVDNKVGREPNYVSVHFEDSYVAAFGTRTYTIQILEGEYGLAASYAQFMYHPGGTPAPEDTADRDEPTTKEGPTAPKPPKQIPGRIHALNITLRMPSPEESPVFNDADLTLEFTGPAHFLTTYLGIPADGKKRRFAFYDIPAGTYNMEINWAEKSIVQSVDVYENVSKLDLIFY